MMSSPTNHDDVASLPKVPKPVDDADAMTAITADSTFSSLSFEQLISLPFGIEDEAFCGGYEREEQAKFDVDVSVFSPTIDARYHASPSNASRFLPVPLRCKTNKDKLISLLSMRCWGEAAARSQSAEGKDELRSEDHYGDGTLPLHHACGCGAPWELVEALLADHPGAAQVADKLNGNLPIHYASYRSDASARVLDLVTSYYPDGAQVANDCGWLPLHYAASADAPLPVLKILLDAHPNGAATRDRFGNLPVHHLSFSDVEKAELLLRPILDNEEACRSQSKLFGGMLPLHVAAKIGVSTEIIKALLNAYPGGANVRCLDVGGRWNQSQGPIIVPDERYALDLLEDQRPLIEMEKESAEFDEKSDLLFFYNPNLRRYRTEARLDRIISRVTQSYTLGVLAWPLRFSSSNMDFKSTALSSVDDERQAMSDFHFRAQYDGKESSMDDTTSKLAKLMKLRSDILKRIVFARKRHRRVVSCGHGGLRRSEETSDQKDYCERLPLHFSLILRAPTDMIRKFVEKTPELAAVANKQGLLPLHVAAAHGAQQELFELLLQSYPQAAITQDCLGDLPVHHLARHLSKCNIRPIDSVHTIQLLLEGVARNAEACKSTGSVGVVLPLHIAAEYAVEIGIFEKMLETYPHAASQLQVRPGTRNQYALDIIESKRMKDVCVSTWNDDFNLKCDILFAHNPDTSWCLDGSIRLRRLKTRIRSEAEGSQPLTAISERVWVWMCTQGKYESTVKDILDGLPIEALRKMAKIKTATGLTVMEGSTIECRQVIRSFLLFAGRYAIEETETPLHVSPTCVVLRARDYGQKTSTDDLHGETARPVVIKFMYSKEQFQREKSSRQRIELVDDKFPPVVQFEEDFDVDRGNQRDLQFRDSIDKFRCHDVANFRFSLVMKEADRTLDDIQKHECPSVNEIRLIMEQIGEALKRLHSKNIVHADIKPMNVVRLNSHITLIDLDSSCRIAGRDSCRDGDEFAGSKFSSGVLPPEMIYELKDMEETRIFLRYWEEEAADFVRVEALRQDFNHEMSSNLTKLLAQCRSLDKDSNWRNAFSFYTKRSSTFEEMTYGCSSAEDLRDKWFSMKRNACRWRKLKPQKGKSGRMYVVKSFQRGRQRPLPYALVPASVSLDMWSFGILLYSLCTNTSLFVVDRVKDDLDSGEAMEQLAKWNLDKVACQQKLSRATNELACDLLQSLLQAEPKKRPRSMDAVVDHDFFRPVNAKLRLELELKELKEELRSEAHDREEFQDLAKSLPFGDLFHRQKWEVVKMKIKGEPSAVPRDLLHEACKYGPPYDVLQTVVRVDRTLFRERNGADDLPIHLACFFGADVKAFELLVSMYPESLLIRNGLGETPLDTVQSNLWTYSNQNQISVIDYLRRYHFPGNFDSTQMTSLPLKSAFAMWAHMAPPGSHSATAAIVLSIDISGFKAVNEHAGTDIGDSTIKEYATQIQEICSCTGSLGSTGLRTIVNVFRMGGDEFAVVVMFEADSYEQSLRKMWNTGVEQMVMDISALEQNGRGRKGIYFTFPRIGCSAGEVSKSEDMANLRLEAERLQEEVKSEICLKRGESVSLREIRADGALNMKLCDDLSRL